MSHFGPDLFPPHVTSFLLEEGRLWCLVFLVIKETPPFSAGWMPTACSNDPLAVVMSATGVHVVYLVIEESSILRS